MGKMLQLITQLIISGCGASPPQKQHLTEFRKSTTLAEAVTLSWSCSWHAADTAPLEGLSILRCAIYDPVEGLQISKMRFSEMGV